MKNTSPLQIGIYVACGIGIVLAVAIFSGKLPIGKAKDEGLKGTVVMWGTLPSQVVREYAAASLEQTPDVRVTYIQKDSSNFQSDLVNALASGAGPDLVVVSPADVIVNKDRLLAIPFTSLPLQTFKDTFVDQASLFVRADGILALPMFIDPLVMYYNRDLLTSSFAVKPPATWDDVVALNKQLTRKDDAGALSVETVAMGTFDNILHAKEILTMITLQAGGTIIGFDENSKKYISTLSYASRDTGNPFSTALALYSSFSNSNDSDHYSWNASLPLDSNQFIAGKLALYFGYGSELTNIRKKNPNLNFDVAMVPQSARRPTKVVYGKMMGIAVTKMSKQIPLSVTVANALTQKSALNLYLKSDASLAPARKDMLSEIPNEDAIRSLIYKSAIISKSFLDPEYTQTALLFKRVIDQINSGVANPDSSVMAAEALMKNILDKVQN
jgi:multiple sugar transport system substrate-binding protein